jgi:mannosyltransferase OCH1-like enzyme
MGKIPKITHQIWFQGWDNLPEKFWKNVNSLHDLNENWEHMNWDEKSLRKECKKFGHGALAKFDSFDRMMAKICFARVIVLYNYGGISIDTDAESLRPLDKIPGIEYEKLIISKMGLGKFENYVSLRGMSENLIMFNNATIACTRHNFIIKEFIKFLIENDVKDDDPQFEEQIQTGPLITSIFFNNYLDEIGILDHDIIEPMTTITKRTVLNHEYELSWTHPLVRMLSKPYIFMRNNIIIIQFILIILLFYIK